jgi:16S rRNA (adenine1518-N6/adenine1519-N6)-dimethyltransferase
MQPGDARVPLGGGRLPAGAARSKKRLGQHFLVNRGAIEAICGAALSSGAPAILEIGPGRGALTGRLLADGRPLAAVELDEGACELLAARFGGAPNFALLRGDAVTAELPPGPLCVVGNLPYNAATAILARFLLDPAACASWSRMVLMFQLEVGRRLLGRPGEKAYGPLSVLAQTAADVKELLRLGPGSFRPPPAVDSVVLAFEPRPGAPAPAERAAMLSLLHAGFAHRRKTLAGSLSRRMPGVVAAAACAAAGAPPGARAEDVPPAAWLEMARLAQRPAGGMAAGAGPL